MPAERFYIESPLQKNQQVTLDEGEHRHLAQVMRIQLGEEVELVNGKGYLAQAKVTQVNKRDTTLEITNTTHKPPSKTKIILAQALPRINRLDFIIEKGTELGVDEFWLFPGERSERKSLTDHQVDRLKSLSLSALKQSGRLWLPIFEVCPALSKWDAIPTPALFGDLNSSIPISVDKETKSCILFIGPEAGFSDNEIKILKDSGCKGIKLHDNILRTDTAAIAGIVRLSALIN